MNLLPDLEPQTPHKACTHRVPHLLLDLPRAGHFCHRPLQLVLHSVCVISKGLICIWSPLVLVFLKLAGAWSPTAAELQEEPDQRLGEVLKSFINTCSSQLLDVHKALAGFRVQPL